MTVFIVLGALVLLVASKFHNEEDLIDEINASQNLWIVSYYCYKSVQFIEYISNACMVFA